MAELLLLIAGILVALAPYGGLLALLSWVEVSSVNHDRLVYQAQRSLTQNVPCSPINHTLDGSLVHMTCPLSNFSVLGQDEPILRGVPPQNRTGISLFVDMKVYQWIEYQVCDDNESCQTRQRRDWSYNKRRDNRSLTGPICSGDHWLWGVDENRVCYNWDPAEVEPWWSESGYQLGANQLIDSATNILIGDFIVPREVFYVESSYETAFNTHYLGYSTVLTPACQATNSSNENTNRDDTETNDAWCAPGLAYLGSESPKFVKWQQSDVDGSMIPYLYRKYTLMTMPSPDEPISILAQQKGDTFVPWTPSDDEGNEFENDPKSVFMFRNGNMSGADMMKTVENPLDRGPIGRNVRWIVRCITIVLAIPFFVMPVMNAVPELFDAVLVSVMGLSFWWMALGFPWINFQPRKGTALVSVGVALFAAACLLKLWAHCRHNDYYFSECVKPASGPDEIPLEERQDMPLVEEL